MSKARRTIRDRDILEPSKILGKLVSDYTDGVLDDKVFLYRAQVVAIDLVGGQLEETPAPNPPGSVKARILTLDRYKTDDDLTVFWPLFPYDLMPVKENEHIYVIFEDPEQQHGLWLSRIPEPNNVNKLNLTPGSAKYQEDSSNEINQSVSIQQHVLDIDEEVQAVETSSQFTVEEVPLYKARVGDRIIHGSNNTLISLGRDRVDEVTSGLSEEAGTIDLVVGRAGENNNFSEDKSRIYISSKTNADENFSVSSDAGEAVSEAATIVVKSNEIRIIAREGTKIVNEGGDIVILTPGDTTIEGANINIGLNAEEAGVLGDKLKAKLEQLCDAINQITVPTSMGPSGTPNNAAAITALKNQLNEILSQTVKVKG